MRCGVNEHRAVLCEKVRNKELLEWSGKNSNVKYCTKCEVRIDKISGCDHMTCGRCGFERAGNSGVNYIAMNTNSYTIYIRARIL